VVAQVAGFGFFGFGFGFRGSTGLADFIFPRLWLLIKMPGGFLVSSGGVWANGSCFTAQYFFPVVHCDFVSRWYWRLGWVWRWMVLLFVIVRACEMSSSRCSVWSLLSSVLYV
jgi:hypothetical protein